MFINIWPFITYMYMVLPGKFFIFYSFKATLYDTVHWEGPSLKQINQQIFPSSMYM